MIQIYSNKISNRLQYCLDFIFNEQLGIGYRINTSIETFKKSEGFKLNYSDLIIEEADLAMRPHALLFESVIKKQVIECFETNGYTAFFKTYGPDFPFDLFAAVFYLLSRYEEYLPHEKDIYGRYAHENSVAYRNGFLNQPLVNRWIGHFAETMNERQNELAFRFPHFSYIPTYDIDMAWSFRNKGFWRNAGGFLRSPSFERLQVLLYLKQDPFDAYEYLDELHKKHNLDPVYFFLVADTVSRYDKNISPARKQLQQLIRKHAAAYRFGIHPSWKSNKDFSIVLKEKEYLETLTKKPVKDSRQHYIYFNLPVTFENLLKSGIRNDYSMGYGSINGFRASVAAPFYWYDLEKETTTPLRLHPFCFMDANSFYEQKQQVETSFDELMYYYEVCKEVNGQLITIFHNNFLGSDRQFNGWKERYTMFTSQLQQ